MKRKDISDLNPKTIDIQKKQLSDLEKIDLEIADYEAAKEDINYLASLKKDHYQPEKQNDATPLFPNKNDVSEDIQYSPIGINPSNYSHSDELRNKLIYKKAKETNGIFPFGGSKKTKTKTKKTKKRFKIKKHQKKRKYTKKH